MRSKFPHLRIWSLPQLIGLLAVSALFGAVPAPHPAGPCTYAPTSSSTNPQSVVFDIDSYALSRFRGTDLSPVGETMFSPLTVWYADSIVSKRFTQHDQLRQISALSAYLATRRSYTLRNAVWVNSRTVTDYTAPTAELMRATMCAPTFFQEWQPSTQAISPSDHLMKRWISQQSSYRKTSTPTLIARSKRDGAYSLSVLSLLTLHVPLIENLEDEATRSVLLPSFSADVEGSKLEGVRLDAKGTPPISLYLLWGSSSAITQLQRTLDMQSWERIKSGFRTHAVLMRNVILSKHVITSWPATAEKAFGTTLAPNWGPAPWEAIQQEVYFSVEDNQLTMSGLAAVRGFQKLPDQLDADYWTPVAPLPKNGIVSPFKPMFFAVEDRATGLLLLLGVDTN